MILNFGAARILAQQGLMSWGSLLAEKNFQRM